MIEKGAMVMFPVQGERKYAIGRAMDSGESTIPVLRIRKTDGGAEFHNVHASKLTPVFWSETLQAYVTIPDSDKGDLLSRVSQAVRGPARPGNITR